MTSSFYGIIKWLSHLELTVKFTVNLPLRHWFNIVFILRPTLNFMLCIFHWYVYSYARHSRGRLAGKISVHRWWFIASKDLFWPLRSKTASLEFNQLNWAGQIPNRQIGIFIDCVWLEIFSYDDSNSFWRRSSCLCHEKNNFRHSIFNYSREMILIFRHESSDVFRQLSPHGWS